MKTKLSRQLGISLLEVLLSLSIIAIILVMATRYFFVANSNDKTNTTVSQIGGLIAAAHNWKGAGYDYRSNGKPLLKELADSGQLTNFPGYSPNGINNSILTSMWGEPFNIAPSSNPSLATITINLPKGVCEAMQRAYPQDLDANIRSSCRGSTFTYTFP